MLITLFTSIYLRGQAIENIKFVDGSINYKTYGKGYPLLIINGGPGMNCEGFSALAMHLSEKLNTILFDQRGTGRSELKVIDSSTVTMDLMVEDMETLRKHLNLKKWIILGHSFGGWLAQHYAIKYPEKVEGLILSGSAGIDLGLLEYFQANTLMRLGPTERDSLNYWSHLINNGDTSYHTKYQHAKVLASAYLYNKSNINKLAERIIQAQPLIAKLVYKDLFKIKYDCKQSLKNFTKPVLIIQGRQDIVGEGTAYKAHLVLKNSKLVFLNECGHYGWLDQKEKYKLEIENFISKLI